MKNIIHKGQRAIPRYNMEKWARIQKMTESINAKNFWMPSHGKRAQWHPGEECLQIYGSISTMRHLNDAADRAATDASEAAHAYFKCAHHRKNQEVAKHQAEGALARQYEGSQALLQSIMEVKEVENWYHGRGFHWEQAIPQKKKGRPEDEAFPES